MKRTMGEKSKYIASKNSMNGKFFVYEFPLLSLFLYEIRVKRTLTCNRSWIFFFDEAMKNKCNAAYYLSFKALPYITNNILNNLVAVISPTILKYTWMMIQDNTLLFHAALS
jgi:hypothetical protein